MVLEINVVHAFQALYALTRVQPPGGDAGQYRERLTHHSVLYQSFDQDPMVWYIYHWERRRRRREVVIGCESNVPCGRNKDCGSVASSK